MSATAPDTFGQQVVPKLTDLSTGIVWTLGFGPRDANGVPAVVWTLVSTWRVAKVRLGPTWRDAKSNLASWGAAKAVVGS